MDFLKAPEAEPSTFETVMGFVSDQPLISALAIGLCIAMVCGGLGIGGGSSDGGGWGDSGGGDGGGGGD
ncbi:MAG: hypothetical protein AAFR46_09290 [Pseudomonadota bacterium]